jgi:DnaD/phage-associated family protein
MKAAEFGEFIQEKGYVTVSRWLLEKYQALNIAPEELGFLLLALFQQQRNQAASESRNRDEAYPEKSGQGDNPWLGRALEKGWAKWSGEAADRQVVFTPLWQKLYDLWEEEQKEKSRQKTPTAFGPGDFDYSRIVKELDRMRGSLSVTAREKQVIQEFHLQYDWSSEFILSFFRLCNQRGLIQMKSYKTLAVQLHRNGVYTLEGLASFMNEVDWIGRQAAEIKKDYLGLYGMVTVTERDLYVKWNVAWGFSHALILRAAREAAGAANATFKYIDTVMESWREQGIDSLEACEQAIQLWRETKKEKAKSRSGPKPATGGRRGGAKERGSSLWADDENDGGSQGGQAGGGDRDGQAT